MQEMTLCQEDKDHHSILKIAKPIFLIRYLPYPHGDLCSAHGRRIGDMNRRLAHDNATSALQHLPLW
jgi:hypothetical protein